MKFLEGKRTYFFPNPNKDWSWSIKTKEGQKSQHLGEIALKENCESGHLILDWQFEEKFFRGLRKRLKERPEKNTFVEDAIQTMVDFCKENGAKKLSMQAPVDSKNKHQVLEKLGFKRTSLTFGLELGDSQNGELNVLRRVG